MKEHISHKDLLDKKQKLQEISVALKERFLGLDAIIDEVTALMMPWYLFPESQLRPTVVNLWGLTGSGKTALVKEIVNLLDHRNLYTCFDAGEFESDSATWIKKTLTDDLEYFDGKSAMICLDEFQFARTLDSHGGELGKDKLRVIWELLDSGKIEYVPRYMTYYLFRADHCIKRIEKILKANVALRNGVVEDNVTAFLEVFDGFYFEDADNSTKAMTTDYFLSKDFVDGVHGLFDNEYYSRDKIIERIKSCSLRELMMLLMEGMQARPATKTLDLSRSLIFVLGNLDEAYSMSHNLNPDLSADEFHEETSRINLAHIKKALRKRFRPEQIARLGNNHIIYRSFSQAQFRSLIRRELGRISVFVKEQFGWDVHFDETVVDVIYAEGVFPAQGTRPVLTTVKNLIESRIGSMAISILERGTTVTKIEWHFNNGCFAFVMHDEHQEVYRTTDEVKLKLENLRKSIDPELQAHIAVHEAGHAVLAALMFRMVPSMVVSRTASDAEGFCFVTFPKGPMTRDSLKKDIIVTLGGYVAERMIFGEEFTSSGVYADIQEASSLANRAITKYAMGSDPIHMAVESQDEAFEVSERYTEESIHLIRLCEVEAEQTLTRNKLLLLKMSEYLTVNSRMDAPLIETFVKQYANEPWVKNGLISKDQYYVFNTILQKQLKDAEAALVPDVRESLSEELEFII
jgi:cell division protease FtsH